jgi:hypothetical protein
MVSVFKLQYIFMTRLLYLSGRKSVIVRYHNVIKCAKVVGVLKNNALRFTTKLFMELNLFIRMFLMAKVDEKIGRLYSEPATS